MKSSLLRNTIVTSLLGAVMAFAMPLTAAAQDRDRNDRGGDNARYYSRHDDNRDRERDNFDRERWEHRDRDDRWRRDDDGRRPDFRRYRDGDDGRGSLRFFIQVNPHR